MHHDPIKSTYARGTSRARHVAFAFGHNWVILALWIPLPWGSERGAALPVLIRLYRSKKLAPKKDYLKRTAIAAEMIAEIARWLPEGRKLLVVGDSEYACKTVLRALPEEVDFVGPMVMDARIFAPLDSRSPSSKPRRGAPRKRGPRLPCPLKLANSRSTPWRKQTVMIYGRSVEVLLKTRIVLWYSVCHTRRVQLVLTRDPKGRIADRAYFSTVVAERQGPRRDLVTAGSVLRAFSRRWSLEVTFFNSKQFLGLEDPQNGWGRRPRRPKRKRPGPQPCGSKGSKAARRTVPLILYTYGLAYIWYLKNGNPKADVDWVRKRMPWYRKKRDPSFADILRAIRRVHIEAQLKSHPLPNRVAQDIVTSLVEVPLVA